MRPAVQAYNEVGFSDSTTLVLRHALEPATIVRLSEDSVVLVGGTLALDVVATGDPAPTYQVGTPFSRFAFVPGDRAVPSFNRQGQGGVAQGTCLRAGLALRLGCTVHAPV